MRITRLFSVSGGLASVVLSSWILIWMAEVRTSPRVRIVSGASALQARVSTHSLFQVSLLEPFISHWFVSDSLKAHRRGLFRRRFGHPTARLGTSTTMSLYLPLVTAREQCRRLRQSGTSQTTV